MVRTFVALKPLDTEQCGLLQSNGVVSLPAQLSDGVSLAWLGQAVALAHQAVVLLIPPVL